MTPSSESKQQETNQPNPVLWHPNAINGVRPVYIDSDYKMSVLPVVAWFDEGPGIRSLVSKTDPLLTATQSNDVPPVIVPMVVDPYSLSLLPAQAIYHVQHMLWAFLGIVNPGQESCDLTQFGVDLIERGYFTSDDDEFDDEFDEDEFDDDEFEEEVEDDELGIERRKELFLNKMEGEMVGLLTQIMSENESLAKYLPDMLIQLSVLVNEKLSYGETPEGWENWMDLMRDFGNLSNNISTQKE